VNDVKADGALEQVRRLLGPLRFFALNFGLVKPAVELAN
jgi:hypothetical protein